MKIQLEQAHFLTHCASAQNIAEKKNAMSVLLNVMLEATDEGYKLFATDLEISLVGNGPSKVEKTGRAVVSAKNLFEIVRELAPGPLSLEKLSNNWLEVRQGRYVSKIVGINPDEFPIFPSFSGQSYFEIESRTLLEIIDKTIFAVSTDTTRSHLNGVYFEVSPQNGLKMVSTDGHRLCLAQKKVTELKYEQTTSHGVIVPRKGLGEIRKVLEGVSGSIRIAIEGAQFILSTQNTTLMIRLIEGRYPNYQQFIPASSGTTARVKRETLVSALKRVSFFAHQKSKAVLMNFSTERLELVSSNPEMGDAREEIEVELNGKEIKIGFNAKYLMDVLLCLKDEFILFELNDQISQGVIKSFDDPGFIAVIMPMRI